MNKFWLAVIAAIVAIGAYYQFSHVPAQRAAQEAAAAAECEVESLQARPNRISWAGLLKRVFDIDMQRCPNCGAGELKIIAAILERPVIEKILTHLCLDPQPPPRGRAREIGQN
jgi:hypothetical protein